MRSIINGRWSGGEILMHRKKRKRAGYLGGECGELEISLKDPRSSRRGRVRGELVRCSIVIALWVREAPRTEIVPVETVVDLSSEGKLYAKRGRARLMSSRGFVCPLGCIDPRFTRVFITMMNPFFFNYFGHTIHAF